MNDTATLLISFGFTARDAIKIARCAHEKGLTLEHVQAWIHEAEQSTSLYNPHGFVRARIEDGDKMVRRPEGDPHIANRQRYLGWSPRRLHIRFQRSYPLTQACACGRVVYATHICPDCGTCPTCCTCDPTLQDEE